MGEKKVEKRGDEKKGNGGKKDEMSITVVLRVNSHGVASVIADGIDNNLTTTVKVDPEKIRWTIEMPRMKKLELDPPAPKNKPANKGDPGKKIKEPVSATVVLATRVCCEGCIEKIRGARHDIKGVEHVSVDAQKDLVTVKGTMDAKELASYLEKKLNRNVEIVHPKKDGGGGDKKAKEGGGGGEKKDKKK